MRQLKYSKELYSKTALIKAAYNFTDKAYLHLDADNDYYYVSIVSKNENQEVSEKEFENEILAQSARHQIYLQTKNIRELMLARAVATSVVTSTEKNTELDTEDETEYNEDEILRDWFDSND
ncbi:His-Xaa-Ser system protein HxsD [uncultured Catenibacterium sp.]|uniref:His-Xaa-Ser system protein HxsD n=1 Tax=uncultured Catenibacterium sp. TaxID=286142 RepID=UPI0025D08F7A|nr:His-Xaa-Ser system protein HxsD [uncultured Catenibacterium sp.]